MTRKRVEAEVAGTGTTTSMIRARDGSAFARWYPFLLLQFLVLLRFFCYIFSRISFLGIPLFFFFVIFIFNIIGMDLGL